MSEVYGLIRKLGATSKYKGYYYVAEAVNMAKELQERPMKITYSGKKIQVNTI